MGEEPQDFASILQAQGATRSEEMHCGSIVCVPVLCAISALMGADDAIEKYLVGSGYWQNESWNSSEWRLYEQRRKNCSRRAKIQCCPVGPPAMPLVALL